MLVMRFQSVMLAEQRRVSHWLEQREDLRRAITKSVVTATSVFTEHGVLYKPLSHSVCQLSTMHEYLLQL